MSHTSAEHRAECAVLGMLRKQQGRPVWDERIDVSDVFHDNNLTFEGKRDVIVARIRNSRWFRRSEEYSEIRELVDELSGAEDVDHFDCVWDAIYDAADLGDHRVWINTF